MVDIKRNGLETILKEEYVNIVVEVKRVRQDHEFERVMLNVASSLAPQIRCQSEERKEF